MKDRVISQGVKYLHSLAKQTLASNYVDPYTKAEAYLIASRTEMHFFHQDKDNRVSNKKSYTHTFDKSWMEIGVGWSNTTGISIMGINGTNYHKPNSWLKVVTQAMKSQRHSLVSGEVYIAARYGNDWRGMKIKMRYFILSFFFLFSISSFAQWGVEIGPSLTTITDLSASKYKFNGQVGATYDIKLSSKWYIQSGLTFSANGTKLSSDGLILKDGHINTYALELPLNMSLRPKITEDVYLIFNLGWFFRYAMFGNKEYIYYEDDKVDESPFDAYKRFDNGISLGVGFKRYYGVVSLLEGLTSVLRQETVYITVLLG